MRDTDEMHEELADPTGARRWLRTYTPMLLVAFAVVAWMTRGFGYHSLPSVRARRRAAAEGVLPFETVRFDSREMVAVNTDDAASGDGRAVVPGDWVTAQITGWHDGEGQRNFWSSTFEKSRSVTFEVGVANSKYRVLAGIDRAVLQMKVGERAEVAVSPDLAFGARGKQVWGIDSWEILHFHILVLSAARTRPEGRVIPFERLTAAAGGQELQEAMPAADESAEPATVALGSQPPAAAADAQGSAAGQSPRGGGAAAAAEAAAPAGPTVDPSLLEELKAIGLARFAPDLAGIGLVSVDDVAYLESVGDLPDSIPVFTRKKLVAWAAKHRQQQGAADAAATDAKKEDPQPVEKAAGATASAAAAAAVPESNAAGVEEQQQQQQQQEDEGTTTTQTCTSGDGDGDRTCASDN